MADEVFFRGGFSSTSVKFTCNNNHEAKDFFFFSKLIPMKDKKCPAIFQICKIKKKLHQTLFRVAVHEEGVNSLAKWFKNEPPV